MILPIHAALKDRLHTVLTELYGLDTDAVPEIAVQYPPDRSLGDLGIPVAFELARTLRRAPRTIAAKVVAALGRIDGIARAEAAPNGYVNVFLDRAMFVRKTCTTPAAAATAPATKTIVEHTAINPNKAAHIGHLRNSALGDTLARVLRFLGTPVEVQNYIDDTGVQVADVVVGFEQLEHASLDDVAALTAQPRFDSYCWDLYARVTEWYAGDDDRLVHRARALRDLETGITPTAAIGRAVAAKIVQCHLATMDRLNVEYDLLSWEGDILRLEFWARAFAVLQRADAIFLQTEGPQAGCWVMPLADLRRQDEDVDVNAGADSATEEGPYTRAKIIVRSNGTVTYVGKDIAYQFWKFGLLDRDFRYRHHSDQRSGQPLWSTTAESDTRTDALVPPAFGDAAAVYNVIDTRQSYLQALLKQALTAIDRRAQADRSVHVSYEMVALSHGTARALGYDADPEERRPFVEVSGRKGLGVKANDLLDRVTAAARREVLKRHVDLAANETEAERIASIIAVAAIRYFMIKYSRGKLIVFDIDEALSFEGESGPYVQYAAVRAEKILQKLRRRHGTDDTALVDALATLPDEPLDDPDGTDLWGLFLEAARLDEIAAQSVRALELSVLAKYTFGLAQTFNTFYHRCPVIAEERRDVRLWRAAAVTYVRLQLGRALDLMGCEVPPRM